MDDLFQKMNDLLNNLSNKKSLIEFTDYKSNIKIYDLEMPPPVVSHL
jgi:hypothetical protein